jgi:hypothetical protein
LCRAVEKRTAEQEDEPRWLSGGAQFAESHRRVFLSPDTLLSSSSIIAIELSFSHTSRPTYWLR